MVNNVGPIKRRVCYKCGFDAETENIFCPRCRRRLQTSSSIRIRGLLLVLCGVIIIGIMSYIWIWTMGVFANAAPGGARFTGTQDQKLSIIGLFASLLLFGFVSFAAGMWQLILGTRNRIFVWAVVGVSILIAIGGGAVLWSFDA